MRGLALLLLVLGGVGVAVAPRRPAGPATGAEVYRRAAKGTAWVLAAGQGKGSGFVVDAAKRHLVTCYHVVGENETCEVVFLWEKAGRPVAPRRAYLEHLPELRKRGLAVEGRVIRRSKEKDLALVELPSLPAGAEALPLAGAAVGPGERVWAVGNRYDSDSLFTASAGRVRAVRSLREGYFSGGRQLAKGARLILADAPINEGDSGGPLVNERAEVVGVCAAVAWEAHGGGLSLDLSELRAFLGDDTPASPVSSPGAAAYRKALHATALVQYEGGDRAAGVVVDRARRLILTTADAVAREKAVEVTFPVGQPGGVVGEAAWYRARADLLRRKGHRAAAVMLAVDPRRNLALLEAERLPDSAAELTPARAEARPGDLLHLVSHPGRLEVLWAYSAAVVRQRGHQLLGREEDGPAPAVLIVQAPLSDGEGGGPALDERGELAGLVSGKVGPQQQIAHVLAASEVRAFLEEARPSYSPRSPAEHLARAERFAAARRFDLARAEYSAGLKREPNHAALLAGRAWVEHLRGEPAAALADAGRALELDPKQSKARIARAAVWLARGDGKRAVAECEAAIKDDPKNATAFALRALARPGDLDRALADADEAVWLDARLALAYLARGRVLARRGQNDRAREELSRALALDSRLAEAYRARAEVAWLDSKVDDALADYSEALKHAPEDVLALLGRGRGRLAKGDHDSGLEDLDRVIRLRPALAEAYLVRGGEKLRRNWVSKGAADLIGAVERDPATLAAALAELQRKSADLPAGDEAEAYRLVLEGVAGKLEAGLRGRVRETLKAAAAEKDEKKRAEAMRSLLALVRARLAER